MAKKLKLFIIRKAIDWLREIDDVDLKRAILTESIKKLYNAIGPEDILKQNTDGSFMFKGRPLTQIESAQLREEAALLKRMKIWLVIRTDIKYQLGKKMFEEAKVKDDIVWGQLLTYLNDVINTRIEKL